MDLIALLRQTPKLQFLCLSGAIESGSEHDPFVANQPTPPVNLADLRFISLSGSGWEAAYILRLLPILQKPRRCGLDLSLPPYADLPHPSVPERAIRTALSWAQRGLHGGSTWMPPFTTPRVEMTLRTHRSGIQLTVGTISEPQRKLNWNGSSGSSGVTERLKSQCIFRRAAPYANRDTLSSLHGYSL
ncbi:hypothetical protein FA13DRAFT_1085278 [Coprinellus micaceus]|uniref:Uncharacterized protein n=1 Tax=Coprinellus micaceus TaxID=71717 RepID=A0A4Y7TT68_COPMI|nr:hypothetical protein FA13DRAFT_1085278 [Coprinellus micaceus]